MELLKQDDQGKSTACVDYTMTTFVTKWNFEKSFNLTANNMMMALAKRDPAEADEGDETKNAANMSAPDGWLRL